MAGRPRRTRASARAVVVGVYEVDALLDAEGSFATYAEAFPDAGEDDWAPWRDRHPELFDGDRWRLPFRSYLIRGGGRTILVDTGVGSAGRRVAARAAGVAPGGARARWARHRTRSSSPTSTSTTSVGTTRSRGARFVAHRESVALCGGARPPAARGNDGGRRRDRAAPGVVAFETPGHLPGHMSLRIGDELVDPRRRRRAPGPAPRPGLVYVSDDDAGRSAQTREEALTAYGDRILACGHFPASGFGRIDDGAWSSVASGRAIGSAHGAGRATTRSSSACARSWPSRSSTRSSSARPTTSST